MIHILWNRLERDVSQIDVAYPFFDESLFIYF